MPDNPDTPRASTRKTLHPAPERPDLDALLARARHAFDALSPEEQKAMIQVQRESWVRGNIGIDQGPDARRTISADTPCDGDVERMNILRMLHRQCNEPLCAVCVCLREIARLRAAHPAGDAKAVVEAARRLLRLPRETADAELGGESYTARYIKAEAALREAIFAYDAIERGEHGAGR